MRLIVGRIAKPHGIRGEVLVEVRTDEPGARFAVGSTLVVDPTGLQPVALIAGAAMARAAGGGVDGAQAWRVPETLTIVAARPHQDRYIVLFKGIPDRNTADALRGALLAVDRSVVSQSDDPDEFSDHDLVGLVAVDVNGERLGAIVRVDHALSSDLLVLRQPSGKTSLVPFVKAIVPEVDLAAGRVVLTPPEGLLDL